MKKTNWLVSLSVILLLVGFITLRVTGESGENSN